MRTRTIKECISEYESFGAWLPEFQKEREGLAALYPFSVVVEGNYLEFDMATEWLKENLGTKGKAWDDIFFRKTAYDFGFEEFFFKSQAEADKFLEIVPKVYADATSTGGNKWRSDGPERDIDVD